MPGCGFPVLLGALICSLPEGMGDNPAGEATDDSKMKSSRFMGSA
jgi:hypothetical protein